MTEEVRFVHAADTHLGAAFAGVDAADARVRDALVRATRAAFERVIDACVERDVDFLVLAGDVLDSGEPSLAGLFAFQAGMRRLAAAGIPAYVARGNHDPADGRSVGLEMPDLVHYFATDKAERIPIERDGRLVGAVYGRSFATRDVKADLAASFEREPCDPLAVAVLHTNVGGRPEHEPYAPSRLADLQAARMDYWALGHIHKAETLSDEPAVAYAGSTQGLNPNETGWRGCFAVTLRPGEVAMERVDTAAVVWAREVVDVQDASGVDDILAAARAACERLRDDAGGRPIVVRLELAGRTAAHHEIARDPVRADLLAELRDEQMSRSPWVWVDRLSDRLRPPLDLDAIRNGADLAADLVLAADEILADPAASAEILEDTLAPVRSAFGDVWDGRLSPTEVIERARDVCLDAFGLEEA